MPSVQQTRRVAGVQLLNARPLSGGPGDCPRVALTLGLPAEVARRIDEDEADVALMPVAAAATIGDLRMVRGSAIGARGPVRSVLIVADTPIFDLDEVALDLSSRTSVVLARLVLGMHSVRAPKYVGLGPSEAVGSISGSRGALIIGDPELSIVGK